MIILLTGLPRAGKTSVLTRFLERFPPAGVSWVVSHEMRDEAGERSGFRATTSGGEEAVFARKGGDGPGPLMGPYRIDLPALERVFTRPVEAACSRPPRLFVFDEIGRMQMLSPAFVKAVDRLFAGGGDALATIRHGDAWTEPYNRHPDAVLLEVTPGNREALPELLAAVFAHADAFHACAPAQRRAILGLARRYAEEGRLVSFRKLFGNAARYVAERRVASAGADAWTVAGDHAVRNVRRGSAGKFACDCDLAKGAGPYAGAPGECSHVQAVEISAA